MKININFQGRLWAQDDFFKCTGYGAVGTYEGETPTSAIYVVDGVVVEAESFNTSSSCWSAIFSATKGGGEVIVKL